jgi:hypothetical protein
MLYKEHTKRSTCRRLEIAHPDGRVQVSRGIFVRHARETREDSRDKKGCGVSHTDRCRKTTYKGVNVDRKTGWSAESITGIRWRDASGSRAKCSERRTLTGCNNYSEHTAGRATDIPKCMLLAVTARMAVGTPKCILLAVTARRAIDIPRYMLAMQDSSV